MSPSGFGTTTSGETHSVGPLGTSLMMSSLRNSSSFLSTLSLKPKCNLLTGCAIETSLFKCYLSWKSFNLSTAENTSAKFLAMSTEVPSLVIAYAFVEFGGSNSQHIQRLSCILSQQSFATTFNNSKLIHALFSRLFTIYFTFKSSTNLNWFGLAISKQLECRSKGTFTIGVK